MSTWPLPKSSWNYAHMDTQIHVACTANRVGLARTVYAPYMTLYLVVSLPKIPYIHCIYLVLANPIIE